jgi:hypothetical protein
VIHGYKLLEHLRHDSTTHVVPITICCNAVVDFMCVGFKETSEMLQCWCNQLTRVLGNLSPVSLDDI